MKTYYVVGHLHVLSGDLCFASEELESGLCLEFNHISDSRAYSRSGFYRLLTWGVFRHTTGAGGDASDDGGSSLWDRVRSSHRT